MFLPTTRRSLLNKVDVIHREFLPEIAGWSQDWICQSACGKDMEIFPDKPPQSLKKKRKLTTCPSSKPTQPKFHSKGLSIASQRESNLAFRPSMEGNLPKLSLDLSSIDSSFSLGVAALASTTASADSHVPSSNTSFDP
jgi:hypothetical protein